MPSSARLSAFRPNCARLLRPRLHVRLVDLHDVGAGGEEIADLLVDRRGVVQRRGFLARVEVVLRLLRHRERAGHGDLRSAASVCALAGTAGPPPRPACLRRIVPDDARHRIGMARAIERGARVVEVHAVERGGEAVGVALAADLAVGDDVEAGLLLGADGQQRGVVLRLRRARARARATARGRARAAESVRPASPRSISQSGCG